MPRRPNGALLRKLRRERGLTIRQVMEKTGLSDSTLRNIEKGRNSNPELDVLDRLAEFYGFATVEDILVKKGQRRGQEERDRGARKGASGEGRP